MNLLEFLEIQNEIISEQASAIGDLLGILRQYMTIDEIEALSVKEKIDHAAQIRMELGG